MKKSKVVKGTKQERRQRLLVLLALAAFVVFLGLFLGAEPVYADSGSCSLDPGEGGTHPNTVDGFVKNYATGSAVPGLNVYINVGWYTFQTTTDASGYFIFQGSYISPNSAYKITINGIDYYLGQYLDDFHWGQWAGYITTDNIGYGHRYIYLQPAAIVNVPAAALFSNTKYATLRYGMETVSSFSHTLNFNVAVAGISTGYTTSTSASWTFEVNPLIKAYAGKPYYAATYWDDIYICGVASSGIAHERENWYWGTYETQEYIDPNTLTGGYVDFQVAQGTKIRYDYKETGSHTWSVSSGVGFAISYKAFSVSIGVDTKVTVTAGSTNWVSYEVDRLSDTNPDPLIFRAYTPGALLNPGIDIGGMELHVWDMSGAG